MLCSRGHGCRPWKDQSCPASADVSDGGHGVCDESVAHTQNVQGEEMDELKAVRKCLDQESPLASEGTRLLI